MASENATEAEIDIDQIYAVIGILSVFSLFGTIGNALAFYVFYNLKQKLTSTIFILTLAGTDFISCLVTIPFTIALESLKFAIPDSVCKMYHFLITTTIPLSAFVMVAIAVDRYLCICHPFLHIMTIRRAKIIVACLSVLALLLGVIACIHYQTPLEILETRVDDLLATVKPPDKVATLDSFAGTNIIQYSSFPTGYTNRQNLTSIGSTLTLSVNITTATPFKTIRSTVVEGQCKTNEHVINAVFFLVYQKIYSALFLICCLIVLALYSLIYRFVISQREKRLQIKSGQCCWSTPTENPHMDCEQSEATVAMELSQTTNGDKNKTTSDSPQGPLVENNTANGTNSSMSRTRLERMRMANIKTAFMLFIVTLVFIVAFLPAWLMAHKLVTLNLVVFYMYFIYNVANPFIYAFLNNTFRVELRNIFRSE